MNENRDPCSFFSAPPPLLAPELGGTVTWRSPMLACRNCRKACRSCPAGPFNLHLGCGPQWRKLRPDPKNIFLDVLPFGQHVQHNLEHPLPFPPQFAQLIQAHHVFEHVNSLPRLLADCWRVLRFGGRLEVVVPSSSSDNAHGDLTHCRTFAPQSLDVLMNPKASNHPFEWPYPPFSAIRKTLHTDQEIGWFLLKEDLAS